MAHNKKLITPVNQFLIFWSRVMKKLFLAGLIFVSPVEADGQEGCETLALRFAEKLAAAVERRSEIQGNIFMRHGGVGEFVVYCQPRVGVMLTARPGAGQNFALMAGAVALEMDQNLGPTAFKSLASCFRSAKRTTSQIANAEVGALRMQCDARSPASIIFAYRDGSTPK